ncbi:hypothetical protein CHELA20_50404 [Hyphomicrobiales bacterium]|nr:hypothetical protein CHELA20_50404 [Hyphomicrobiales bacterium]
MRRLRQLAKSDVILTVLAPYPQALLPAGFFIGQIVK